MARPCSPAIARTRLHVPPWELAEATTGTLPCSLVTDAPPCSRMLAMPLLASCCICIGHACPRSQRHVLACQQQRTRSRAPPWELARAAVGTPPCSPVADALPRLTTLGDVGHAATVQLPLLRRTRSPTQATSYAFADGGRATAFAMLGPSHTGPAQLCRYVRRDGSRRPPHPPCPAVELHDDNECEQMTFYGVLPRRPSRTCKENERTRALQK